MGLHTNSDLVSRHTHGARSAATSVLPQQCESRVRCTYPNVIVQLPQPAKPSLEDGSSDWSEDAPEETGRENYTAQVHTISSQPLKSNIPLRPLQCCASIFLLWLCQTQECCSADA